MTPAELQQTLLNGQKLAEQRQWAAAAELFISCLPWQRNNFTLHAGIGNCLIEMRKYDQACLYYRVAVNLNHKFIPGVIGYADALLLARKTDKALAHLQKHRKYFEVGTEDHGIFLGCLANAYKANGNLEEADRLFSKALSQAPNYGGLWTACGNLMTQERKYDEAGMCYQKAVELSPSYITYNNLSSHYLNIGNWDEAWKVHEQRLASPFRGFGIDRVPWWTGESIRGTLAVFSEQGHGDFFHFSRYLSALQWKVPNWIFVVHDSQLPVAQRMNLGVEVTAMARVGSFQVQTSLMSLPFALGLPDPRNAPPILPMRVEPHDFSAMKKPVVCLMWEGNPENPNAIIRDIPLRLLAPLVRGRPDIHWITTSPGENIHQDIKRLGLPIEQRLGSWDRTADNLAGCDLMITVDTGAGHLAGTLGVPTWLMLASFTDWRWAEALGPDNSVWYPSMRLFRQELGEDWPPVLKRVSAALREHIHPVGVSSTLAP